MNWKWLGFIAVTTILGVLGACSSPTGDQSRRGGGIEIPNGVQASITVRVTDSAGMALSNMPMQLVAGESWASRTQSGKSVVLDSVVTDSLGVVRLDVTESRVFLLARRGNQGVCIALQPRDSAGHDRANPLPVPLRTLGRIALKSTMSQNLAVYGTPWHLLEKAGGAEYLLDSIPQGDYMPVGIEASGLKMGQTISVRFDTLTDVAAMVFSNPENLMIANFENRRVLGIWDPMHVGGYWWATASVDGVNSWDHFGMKRLEDLLDSVDGNVYAGVKVAFVDSGASVANFGLDFSTEPVNTNLSKAGYISFLARGAGLWVFYVQTQDSSGAHSLRWMHPFALTPNWTRYEIPMTSFVCESDSLEIWGQATRLGTNIFWQTAKNGNIDVDDVVLGGLHFIDWVDP